MLQQTQVSRAIPAWTSLLTDMPNPRAAADAGQADIVRRWEGLGYNRRAVGLHRAAVAIVERHDGAVPDDLEQLLALPGVGPYTGRAVLAFAFERDVAVVDTNVARIIARAVAGRPLRALALQRTADGLVGPGDGWRHNQAMLDHGALLCTARAPSCAACPLRRSCTWRRAGSDAPDPARTTAGTSRPQTRFEGSARQARGEVLSVLRLGPAGPNQLHQLRRKLGDERTHDAIKALVGEGTIEWSGRTLHLAGS